MDDYYQLLQVSPTAERHTIEAAHRRLSATTDDPARQARLDEALAVLTDPTRRRRYDRERTAARSTIRRGNGPQRPSQGSALSGKRLAFTAIGAIVAIAAVGGVLALALTGGDDDDPDASPTSSFGQFGPPPLVGDSILDISPAHGVQVPQEDTLSPDADRPENGVCINADFTAVEGITSQWFHIIFDGELVTAETAWILTQSPDVVQPKGGVLCYAPPGGFELGVHDVRALVQDPQGSQPRQVVDWKFEVVP